MASTSYDARTIANFFLAQAEEEHVPLDPMKIQKLVYLAHGWSLALRGRPLIRQVVEAWQYGPVVRDLYNQFRVFHASPITNRANTDETVSPEDIAFLQKVWNTYKQYDALQLSALTHEPGSAWDIAIKSDGWWKAIPNDLIAGEFLRRKQQG